jgi:hypothetical protein
MFAHFVGHKALPVKLPTFEINSKFPPFTAGLRRPVLSKRIFHFSKKMKLNVQRRPPPRHFCRNHHSSTKKKNPNDDPGLSISLLGQGKQVGS